LAPGIAIVRRPSPRLAEGIVTHQQRAEVDAGRALAQWEAYVATMRDHGWRIVEAPPADDHPDGVFVEDAVVVLRGITILTRPGAPQRRGEVDSLAPALAGLGLEPRRITAPATVDGGDVMAAGDTVYVGLTERTNTEGVRQLGEAVEPAGMTVVPVPLSRVLHLKSAATVLPDGTVIGGPELLDNPAVFPRFLAAPEEAGAHVVGLGDGAVLMAAGAPRAAELLERRGLRPVIVDIAEFEKLEGCVTCLSVRLGRP
jgi:dimethylargininase